MVVSDILTASRDLYNSVGDTYFADTLMWNWLWKAANEMARKAWLIENTYSTTTVANQQSYAFPTNTIAIKRATYNGKKIKPVTMRQDDALTLSSQNASTTGTVIYYWTWNYTIYCRPIPDSANTLQIYSYNLHSQITSSSQALEIPPLFQMDLTNYMLSCMVAKDKDYAGAAYYRGLWGESVMEARRWKATQKRTDSFGTVENEEILPVTIMGQV